MSITRRSFLKTTLAAGAALSTITPASTLLAKSRKKYPKSRRVLVVIFDGLRVDGFQQARTPNIDALIADSSVSWTTRDVMPSIILPNYTTHLSGPGIRKGFTITEANNTVNTASTVLRLFDVNQPLCWTGEVPESIFE